MQGLYCQANCRHFTTCGSRPQFVWKMALLTTSATDRQSTAGDRRRDAALIDDRAGGGAKAKPGADRGVAARVDNVQLAAKRQLRWPGGDAPRRGDGQ